MATAKDSPASATVVSTVKRPQKRRKKPQKPYPEFPLYAHAAGVWAKRIRRREHYFGPWSDPDGALDRYLNERDFLFAGQQPPQQNASCTLDELVNRYITAQKAKQAASEITAVHLADCIRDGKRILECLGRNRPVETLGAADFAKLRSAALTGKRGPCNATTASTTIIRQRSIFKWGHQTGLLAEPVNYAGAFGVPSARARRRALRANGPKDLTAGEILQLLEAANAAAWGQLTNLRAMILLGINCGLGNADCAELRLAHLDLDNGLMDFPRPKTDAPRRAVLWPQTVEAIRDALARRAKMIERRGPLPAELSDRVFVTKHRRAYSGMSDAGTVIDSVGMEFRRLAGTCGVHRKGMGFYALRHTFQTVADEGRDFPAIDLVMGHVPDDGGGAAPFAVKMSARYRERISDERLAAVADRVKLWLFGNPKKRPTKRRSAI